MSFEFVSDTRTREYVSGLCPMGLEEVIITIFLPKQTEDLKEIEKDRLSFEIMCPAMDDRDYHLTRDQRIRGHTWCKKRFDLCPKLEIFRILVREHT